SQIPGPCGCAHCAAAGPWDKTNQPRGRNVRPRSVSERWLILEPGGGQTMFKRLRWGAGVLAVAAAALLILPQTSDAGRRGGGGRGGARAGGYRGGNWGGYRGYGYGGYRGYG